MTDDCRPPEKGPYQRIGDLQAALNAANQRAEKAESQLCQARSEALERCSRIEELKTYLGAANKRIGELDLQQATDYKYEHEYKRLLHERECLKRAVRVIYHRWRDRWIARNALEELLRVERDALKVQVSDLLLRIEANVAARAALSPDAGAALLEVVRAATEWVEAEDAFNAAPRIPGGGLELLLAERDKRQAVHDAVVAYQKGHNERTKSIE